MEQKELILSLIKADMCNNKLITGLEKAGMSVEDFYGDLDIQILKLMRFDSQQREDELHDFYYCSLENLIIDIPVEEFRERLPQLALEMYEALEKKKSAGASV